jgi:hypothetical protein
MSAGANFIRAGRDRDRSGNYHFWSQHFSHGHELNQCPVLRSAPDVDNVCEATFPTSRA